MVQKKVAIIGASHGGHQSILELLTRYGKDVDITLFEAGDFISFMSCGMELYLQDKVTDVTDVRNFRPENFPQENVHILANHEVTQIDADNKKLTVVDHIKEATNEFTYDKLILSSGVTPNALPLPGKELENIFLMRGYDWARKIKAKLEDDSVQNVTVIGTGYIGIEAAQVFAEAGRNVTIIDVIDRPLGTYLDQEMTDILRAELEEHGVHVVTGAKISEFSGSTSVTAVKTDQGDFPSDLVIEAAGVKPNTAWLTGTVELDQRGWIVTDEYLRTNLPDVSAVGDATLALSIPAGKKMPIALATVARREARYVVEHLFEEKPNVPFKGVVGSSALSVFDYQFAATGLNEFSAGRAGIPLKTDFYQDTLRPKYVPVEQGNSDVYVKLAYDEQTHQLLGGAVLSKAAITAQGNTLALAVAQQLTLEDLADSDFFFQPGFDRQWSLLNLAAQHALGEEPFVE
ncbi:Peroxidase (Npx) [Amylolactobacillus amylotrophicus DSM 20534]|uniref:FAD-dependent oxidoreductase n=3 Tax=Amylolactobacillus TaxID=2767876 RepID=A0A1L6XAI1_9LACO|nr:MULTISPECIES: FAD-dependent oxidoreductase [Amylolactobacillus]APT17987.1 FAD-dependent oxidoreductase [Amylolactobacillus amylophilus DSM 20533 = JCM 1125]KRK37270.1 Peroxidase (Npx) [Amylolactobacillus amylotrophicus DSM 20534]KRM41669.1 Peroxidase (Npx) [Amylolactobacillus amylophilus DSM 20533 = JCM 1125]GED80733.1 NAD(FAD)-dependent dehydrogenase [Amylolactobacillus amylophilus]